MSATTNSEREKSEEENLALSGARGPPFTEKDFDAVPEFFLRKNSLLALTLHTANAACGI